MYRKLLGYDHPDVAASLNNLGNVLENQGKLADAEAVHRDALAIKRKRPGNEHRDVAASLNNLANVLNAQGKRAEAESFASLIRRKKMASIFSSTISRERTSQSRDISTFSACRPVNTY